MRKNIVAGNWKMNNTLEETQLLLSELLNETLAKEVTTIVAPAYPNLSLASTVLKNSDILVAAQNMHQEVKGAYTGEVSAAMLNAVEVSHVILGHSERRAYFNETNALIASKVDAALQNNITPIFCFGEELANRKDASYKDVIEKQVSEGVLHLSANNIAKVVFAYEPVWAIGTGETASPEQAQEIHSFVRNLIASTYTNEIANSISILYGGSVKPANAKEIFAKPDVDGGLIGGASLNASQFAAIINSF